MTRRRKDPFAEKENVRHFRLVHRPAGSDQDVSQSLKFEEMFEEYLPKGSKGKFLPLEQVDKDTEIVEANEYFEDEDELVDIEAELDNFAEGLIDIEGDENEGRVRSSVHVENVGESAKFGILYDDRGYDYTKHLRKVGVTPGAVFIDAPEMKKKTPSANSRHLNDFFSDETAVNVQEETLEEEAEFIDPEVIKSYEKARENYRSLLHQAQSDPTLREVLEALEDERYVTGEFDDELVLELDDMRITDDQDEEIDIMDDSEAESGVEHEAETETEASELAPEKDELDLVLEEYEDYDFDTKSYYSDGFTENDIDEDIDEKFTNVPALVEGHDEDSKKLYEYLRESGRARGSTLYEKKSRPSHLPPIHIAIAQYDEVRREMAVNNEVILKKYAEEDEEAVEKELLESERILKAMTQAAEQGIKQKHQHINNTPSYLKKGSAGFVPQVIVEDSARRRLDIDEEILESTTESEVEEVPIKVNKGKARSISETTEEKRARKAQLKEEKKDKRAVKKTQK